MVARKQHRAITERLSNQSEEKGQMYIRHLLVAAGAAAFLAASSYGALADRDRGHNFQGCKCYDATNESKSFAIAYFDQNHQPVGIVIGSSTSKASGNSAAYGETSELAIAVKLYNSPYSGKAAIAADTTKSYACSGTGCGQPIVVDICSSCGGGKKGGHDNH